MIGAILRAIVAPLILLFFPLARPRTRRDFWLLALLAAVLVGVFLGALALRQYLLT